MFCNELNSKILKYAPRFEAKDLAPASLLDVVHLEFLGGRGMNSLERQYLKENIRQIQDAPGDKPIVRPRLLYDRSA